jgi:DNA-binding winged helix-turn-helix (wHTH) protein
MAHGDRSVDVFVRKLRAKIQRHSPGWSYIHTHFGIGYRFEAEPVTGEDGKPDPVGVPAPEPAAEPSKAAAAEPVTRG